MSDLGEIEDPQIRVSIMIYYHIQSQIELADTKAQFILAANAILVATATNLYRGVAAQLFDSQALLVARCSSFLGILMFASLIVSFYFALMVAKPSLKVPGKHEENLYFFGGIQLYTGEEFSEKFLNLQVPQIRKGVLQQVYTISHIAFLKFSRIRKSINFLLVAFALWAMAHLCMAFAPGK